MPVNMYPGKDDIEYAKATVKSAEGGANIEVYFNPKDITIDKKVNWKKHESNEYDTPEQEFTKGEPRTLGCEFLFDMYEGDDKGEHNVFTKYVEPLMSLALIDEAKKRPPLTTFAWGKWGTFTGVVTGLNIKYTLFMP